MHTHAVYTNTFIHVSSTDPGWAAGSAAEGQAAGPCKVSVFDKYMHMYVYVRMCMCLCMFRSCWLGATSCERAYFGNLFLENEHDAWELGSKQSRF